MAERKLTVVLAGDHRSLDRTLQVSGTNVDKFGSKVSGMSGRAKTALLGLGGGAIVFGKQSVDAFRESEEAQSKLTEAYAKFPQLAGGNIEALRSLNEQLAKKTKFDDDATASGQAVLAQFGLTQAQLEKVTPLLQDYAERTGKDLPTAAQDLGKAVLGQGRPLKAIGINFKDTGDKAKNFDQLVGGLTDSVGGFAETAGKTSTGKMKIMQNQFGELQEKVGERLIPALMTLTDVGLGLIDFFAGLSPQVQIAIGIVAGLAAGLFVVVQAVRAWTAVQAAFNVVMSANPIILVALAVAAFVGGLVIAYQKVGWFRDLVDGAFRLITGAISGTFNWVKSNWPTILAVLTGPFGLAVLAITRNWDSIKAGATAVKDWIVNAFNSVVSFFGGIPSRISSIAHGMFDGIKNAFKSALNWIIRGWNGLEFRIPGFDPPGPGPSFGGFTLGVPNIPTLHSGTDFFRPPGGAREGLALLERGERVTPAGASGGAQVIDLTVNLDGREMHRQMIRVDADYRSANGRSGFSG